MAVILSEWVRLYNSLLRMYTNGFVHRNDGGLWDLSNDVVVN